MKKQLIYALIAVAVLCAACEPKNDPKEPTQAEEPKVPEPTGSVDGHDYMDLGLPSGTQWATCNVGAATPEAYGDYYAWGETTTKNEYNWDTYKYGSSLVALTKYCTDSEYGIVDNKTVLDAEDDAATANWGAAWCMPTDAQWTELRKQCQWKLENLNGVNGYRVTSNTNSNSIFLPAAGCRYDSSLGYTGKGGFYWSSSLYETPYYAWDVYFDSNLAYSNDNYRCYGQSVRPVLNQ